ncbi:YjcZ family sporulation protein [Alteribacter populi]|nr:YjcZ family sporulation protein [Alteribacter populi]
MMFGFCQPRRVAPVAHVPRRDDTTIAVILVLFILLVIVGCACVKH